MTLEERDQELARAKEYERHADLAFAGAMCLLESMKPLCLTCRATLLELVQQRIVEAMHGYRAANAIQFVAVTAVIHDA